MIMPCVKILLVYPMPCGKEMPHLVSFLCIIIIIIIIKLDSLQMSKTKRFPKTVEELINFAK